MSAESDIKNKLKEALKTSCDDAFYFSDDETKLIDAEYLLTVNAAKAIKELNQYFGEPYKIHLEHNTKKFATACTKLMARENTDSSLGSKMILRTENDTTRSGKIDIAVYTTENGLDNPLCAIEVKGFDPSRQLIVKDLERNAEYFSVVSPTGNSTLPFAAFIALHSCKGVWSDKNERTNLARLKNRYKSFIDGNPDLKSLTHNIEVMTIRRGVLPDPKDPYVQEHGLQGDEDYHFMGVIVVSRKDVSNGNSQK